MKKLTLLAAFLVSASAQLPTQALPADSVFDRLIGHWVLRGTIARRRTRRSSSSPGIGRGEVAGDSVPFEFHYTPTGKFHTIFVYRWPTDSWEWHMDNDSCGVRKPFARVTLTRREPGSGPAL